MSIITDIINIIKSIQKGAEVSKTGVDVSKSILSPGEKKKKAQELKTQESKAQLDQQNSDLDNKSLSSDSGIESDLSIDSENRKNLSLSSEKSSTDIPPSKLSQETAKVGVFSRIKNFATEKLEALRGKITSAREYIDTNYPKTSKVISVISKTVDGAIGVLGGKTACRAFLIGSAAMLFASGIGAIPAGIMIGVTTLAVGIGTAIETYRVRKINRLKDENALTNEYIKTNEQIVDITKDNKVIGKFFHAKDEAIQNSIELRNAEEKPKPSLFVRAQNAVPAWMRNVAKTVRDNLGEAGSYVAISVLTGNIYGIITSSIYFVFGHSTTVLERNTYEKLKNTIRNETQSNATQIPSYKNKDELQELLRQQYIERDTRELLAKNEQFHKAAESGDQNAMNSLYEKIRNEKEKQYIVEPKPGVLKAIGNYFRDFLNVNIKGVMPEESLDHYTDRVYNHSPKVYKINNKINSANNIHEDKPPKGKITKPLVKEAQKIATSYNVENKNLNTTSINKTKEQRSL